MLADGDNIHYVSVKEDSSRIVQFEFNTQKDGDAQSFKSSSDDEFIDDSYGSSDDDDDGEEYFNRDMDIDVAGREDGNQQSPTTKPKVNHHNSGNKDGFRRKHNSPDAGEDEASGPENSVYENPINLVSESQDNFTGKGNCNGQESHVGLISPIGDSPDVRLSSPSRVNDSMEANYDNTEVGSDTENEDVGPTDTIPQASDKSTRHNHQSSTSINSSKKNGIGKRGIPTRKQNNKDKNNYCWRSVHRWKASSRMMYIKKFDFIQREIVGKSGGQFLVWDTNYFDAIEVITLNYAIGIRGKWKSNDQFVNIVNVYGPHEDDKKKQFWISLGNTVSNRDEAWILCEDFNEVWDQSERFNCVFYGYRAKWFNDFILSCELIDISLGGRIYTRVSDDGIKFSKLDRFLVNEKFNCLWDSLEAATVKDSWANSDYNGPRPDRKFLAKLKNHKAELRSWSKNKFGKIDMEIDLHKFVANSLELKAETTTLNDAELELWKNSRKQWYNKSNIRGLNIEGLWNENPQDIKREAFNHFKRIFEEPDTMRPSMEGLLYPSISSDQAVALEHPITESEIHKAILECGSTKAPGPDGFNMRFFKKFWDIVKVVLVEAIKWFWEHGEISRGCNASFVTLVPKKSDPVLPNLVSSEQSAFLKGHFILDGALIANETIDFLKIKKRKGVIFKVDFEKAFDILNWNFLLEVMRSMGFGSKWIKWISSCLMSASISILINGSPTDEFLLGRGVRQGDPLSPFLFILAAEGLNILTKAAIDRGLFKGVEVGEDKVLVSHLKYADDTIFFGEWRRSNALNLRSLLKCFELSSGLKVNFQKSCLYGVGVDFEEVSRTARHIGCNVGKFPFIYVGLPIGAKMNKLNSWDPVLEKFKNRLASWKIGSLSFGGRLVLIKSVLNSLPLYYFSLFRAPPRVLKSLEKVRRAFFWGNSGSGNKITWWRFKTETDFFWAKIIRSIYGLDGGLVDEDGLSHSPPLSLWRNIISACYSMDELQVAFRNSFIKTIGDGGSTSFWTEHWIGEDKLCNLYPRLFRLEMHQSVSVQDRVKKEDGDIITSWSWSRNPSGRTASELVSLINLLHAYEFRNGSNPDSWSWVLDRNGLFTVKKLTFLIDEQVLCQFSSNQPTLRNILVPKKVEIFIWRLLKKRVLIKAELDKRGIDLHSVRCPLCDGDLETIDHSFIQCKQVIEVWVRVHNWWGVNNLAYSSILDLLGSSTYRSMTTFGGLLWQASKWVTTYHIWKNRNNSIMNGKIIDGFASKYARKHSSF
ncbi:uncharacterized protein [Rutidosis leptorrhynchoides]|uniref:uncharacterized protein n=1 Tax=Rutidosis leptorrhynchoides TaxID=125765 RepID=UPI003A9A1737